MQEPTYSGLPASENHTIKMKSGKRRKMDRSSKSLEGNLNLYTLQMIPDLLLYIHILHNMRVNEGGTRQTKEKDSINFEDANAEHRNCLFLSTFNTRVFLQLSR